MIFSLPGKLLVSALIKANKGIRIIKTTTIRVIRIPPPKRNKGIMFQKFGVDINLEILFWPYKHFEAYQICRLVMPPMSFTSIGTHRRYYYRPTLSRSKEDSILNFFNLKPESTRDHMKLQIDDTRKAH